MNKKISPLKMEFHKETSTETIGLTFSDQKWNKHNSLLYLFIDHILPGDQTYSSIDISECVEWLLSGNFSIGTNFQIKVKNKLEPMLKMLLESQNNVHYTNRLEETVLRLFLSKFAKNSENPSKDQELVKLLIKKGASVDVIDSIGYTPLQYAATIRRPDLVQLMIDHSNDLNIRNSLGHTVLHLLVYNYEQHPSELHLEAIRNLLSKGGNINAKNKKGLTPVHLAIQNGLAKVLLIFVDHGIDIKDYIGIDSNLLLYLCKHVGNWTRNTEELKAFNRLIDLEKDVNSRSRKFYLTPLHFVSQVDRPDVIDVFLKAGADIDATSVDGITPLHLAVLQGSLAVMEFLIRCGADVEARDEMMGFGVMHMAVLSGDKDKFNFLVENGFDVNVRSKHGLTPFHVAAIMGDNKMLRCLIERSINFRGTCQQIKGMLRLNSMEIDCMDGKILIGADENVGEMSLIGQYAKSLNVSTTVVDELMMLLLESGGNVNAKDACMKTPLHYVTKQKDGEVGMLLCLGAFMETKDGEGKLPLQNVLDCGNLRGLSKLLRLGANLNGVVGNFHEWTVDVRNQLYNYLIQLKVADLPMSDALKQRLLRHTHVVNMTSYEGECLEEVTRLRNYFVMDSTISLYEFLHMSSRRRLTYAQTVLSLDLDVEFPIYEKVVEAYCREAMYRSLLMKQAGSALCGLSGFNLPEICTNKILRYLINEQLIDVIDSYDVNVDGTL